MSFTLASYFLFLQCQLKSGISNGLVDIKLGERGGQTTVVFDCLEIMAMRSVLSVECMTYLYYAGDFLLSLVLQPVDKALEGDFLCTFLVLPVRGR